MAKVKTHLFLIAKRHQRIFEERSEEVAISKQMNSVKLVKG